LKYNREIHHRRSIRLKEYDYSQAGAYFVTICTWNRECLFGDIVNGRGNAMGAIRELPLQAGAHGIGGNNSRIALNEYGKVVEEYISRVEERFDNVYVEEFIIMPNHMHAIIFVDQHVGVIHELRPQASFAERCKQRRKMLLPKIIGWFKMNTSKSINQMRNTEGRPVWQKNYYEHVVRNEKELRSIQEYIINNPLQWDLDENNPVNIK